MKENIIQDKAYAFALKIIKVCKDLGNEQKEFILSKQLMRSGTSIGALVSKSEYVQSEADFTNKMNIALQEAKETEYWIKLLSDSGYLHSSSAESLIPDCNELIRLLARVVNSVKETCLQND